MSCSLPLAFTGDQWIAVVGILAGVVGTLGGLAFSLLNGRAERAQARALARASRLHAQRLDAYADLAAFMERERLYIQRTEPQVAIGEGQPPPEPVGDEEWLAMQGRVAVAGSAAVEAAVKKAQLAAHKFSGTVFVLRAMRGGTPHQEAGAWEQTEAARTRAVEARSRLRNARCATNWLTSEPGGPFALAPTKGASPPPRG